MVADRLVAASKPSPHFRFSPADCDAEQLGALGGVWGLSAGLPCSKVFRFHWFIMSWELVMVALLAVATVTGKLNSMRTSLVGLFSISTLLFIEASNTFLTAESRSVTGSEFQSGQPQNRLRTVIAGSIMVSSCFCFEPQLAHLQVCA